MVRFCKPVWPVGIGVQKEPSTTYDDREHYYYHLCPTKRLPKAKNTCPGPKTPARRFLESFSPQTWRIISLLVTCWSSSSINSRSIFWYLVVVTSPYYGPIHSGGKTIKKCKAKSYFFLFLISRKNWWCLHIIIFLLLIFYIRVEV